MPLSPTTILSGVEESPRDLLILLNCDFLLPFRLTIFPFRCHPEYSAIDSGRDAGQVPRIEGKPAFIGALGATMSLEEGQKAARLCALNVMAQIKAAVGDLDQVASILRWVGYVASTADFKEHHIVMDGASELLRDIFADDGRHARTSVGVAALP